MTEPVNSSEKNSSYIPCLDGIRACAFLTVFMAHAIPGVVSTYIPATFGVTVFFFLSGYLITTLLRRENDSRGSISLKEFYLRRSLRILPPMYLAYGLTFLAAFFGFLAEKGNLAGLWSSLLYFYNYSQLLTTGVNVPTGMTVLWSLSIEEHFYLIFPVIYVLATRRHTSIARQSCILLGLCLLGLLWRLGLVLIVKPPTLGHLNWTYAATDARFDSLLWGCLLAIRSNPLFNDRAGLLGSRSRAFALAGLALIIASMFVRHPVFRETLRYSLQGLGLYPVFYYCIKFSHHWQVRWLEWKPLRWIGWLSYSLYLIHNAFLLQLHLKYPDAIFVDGVIAFAASILYAWGIRAFIEVPLQGLRKKRANRLSLAKHGSQIAA